MILADTSVWVDHFRRAGAELRRRLAEGEIATHPFVIGELACGSLDPRGEILELLHRLPALPVAQHHEALAFVEARRLMRSGLGWIDVHLLASAVLAGARVWTLDRRLAAAAASIGVA